MTAPKLLAWVVSSELNENGKIKRSVPLSRIQHHISWRFIKISRVQPSLSFVCLLYKRILFLTHCRASYLQRCTFYNRRQNQSGTARPWSNLSQGAPAASATCVRRDHPADSHRSWKKRNTELITLSKAATFNDLHTDNAPTKSIS